MLTSWRTLRETRNNPTLQLWAILSMGRACRACQVGRLIGQSTPPMLAGLSLPFRVCSKKPVENHGSSIHYLGLDNCFWYNNHDSLRVSQREWAINPKRPPTLAMIMTQIKSSAWHQQYSRDTFVIITNSLRKCSQTSPLLAASAEAVGSKSKKKKQVQLH